MSLSQVYNQRLTESFEGSESEGISSLGIDEERSVIGLCLKLEGGMDDEGWRRVRALLTQMDKNGEAAQVLEAPQGALCNIPLHLVCFKKPPPDVVALMLKISPKSAQCPDKEGDLPIHYACLGGACVDVIKLLVECYPDARNTQGELGNTPLHSLFYTDTLPSCDAVRALTSEEVIHITDSEGRSPLDLFVIRVKSSSWLDGPGEEMEQPSSGFSTPISTLESLKQRKARAFELFHSLLELHPAGSDTFISSLKALPSWLLDDALLHPHVRDTLDDKISEKFAVVFIMLNFYANILVVTAFTSFITSQSFTENYNGWEIVGLRIGVIFLTIFTATQFFAVIFTNRIGRWLLDPWIWIDLATIFLLIVSINIISDNSKVFNEEGAYVWDRLKEDGSQNILIATGGLVWIKFLGFLRSIYLPFSMLVAGALSTMKTLIPFLTTTGLVVGAFSLMYYIDFKFSPNCDTVSSSELSFCTLKGSFLKVYSMFINGMIEDQDLILQNSTMWITVVFGFVMVILLLNVLIAIVLDCYYNATTRGKRHYWMYRFDQVSEINFVKGVIFSPCRRFSICEESREAMSSSLWAKCEDSLKKDAIGEDSFEAAESSRTTVCKPVMIYFIKIAALVFMALWFVAGAFTVGFLWPPQVRSWLFSRRTELRESTNAPRRLLSTQIRDILKEAVYGNGMNGKFIDQQKQLETRVDLLLKHLDRKVSEISHPHDIQNLDSAGNIEVSISNDFA